MIICAVILLILLIITAIFISINGAGIAFGGNDIIEYNNKSISSYPKLKKMVKDANIVFLTGRAGVGKSYVGHKLAKDTGYKYISVDDLIMNMVKTHPDEYALFQIYGEGDAYPEERKQLLNEIKEKIKLYGKVILDGMLRPRDVEYINTDLLVYVEPYDWATYPVSIRKRIDADIKNNTKTMGIVWRQLEDNYTEEELIEAISSAVIKQHIYSDKLKKQYNGVIYRNKTPK